MRKLLLGSTTLAAATTLATSVALADVSVSGGYEFTYKSQDSGIASTGSSFDEFTTDADVTFSFTNKTDSGLTIGMHLVMENGGEDESNMTIQGGFGKLQLGADDGAGDQLTRTAHDLVGPDALNDGGGAVVRAAGNGNLADDNADLINDINDQPAITYILPSMGGLTIGASYRDAGSGAANNDDETVVAAKYAFESGAVKGTIHYGTNSIGGANVGDGSLNDNSMALDVSTGPFRAVIAKAESDVTTAISTEVTDYGIQYNVGNGLTLAAVGTQIEENTGGETSDVTTVSAKYNIASGLDAYITYHDYDYQAGSSNETSDDCSWTQVTVKATF